MGSGQPTPPQNNKLIDNTIWSHESYEQRPLGSAGTERVSVYRNGYISNKGTYARPLPEQLQEEFDKHHLISVYYWEESYWFRGFKRASE